MLYTNALYYSEYPSRLLFTTCYMQSANSSSATCDRALRLANQIGSNHMTISIDDMVEATTGTFNQSTSTTPRFKVHGGSNCENLALQNVQARCRMVLAYLYAQLTPWSQGMYPYPAEPALKWAGYPDIRTQ